MFLDESINLARCQPRAFAPWQRALFSHMVSIEPWKVPLMKKRWLAENKHTCFVFFLYLDKNMTFKCSKQLPNKITSYIYTRFLFFFEVLMRNFNVNIVVWHDLNTPTWRREPTSLSTWMECQWDCC